MGPLQPAQCLGPHYRHRVGSMKQRYQITSNCCNVTVSEAAVYFQVLASHTVLCAEEESNQQIKCHLKQITTGHVSKNIGLTVTCKRSSETTPTGVEDNVAL